MIVFISNTYAQDKKFHFGLKVEPTFSWYKPDNLKRFENNGVGMKFGFGLITDFALSENIWFSTGLGLHFDGGKIKYLDSTGYFFLDNEIQTFKSNSGVVAFTDIDTLSEFILLQERNIKANYVNIPLFLKMKTKEIGMMTYLGQFGFNLGIKTKGRTNDVGKNLTSTNNPDLNDLNIDSEMNLLRMQLGMGLGVEYNLSGSTSFLGMVTFNYGMGNIVNKRTRHLIDPTDISPTGFLSYDQQKFIPFNVAVTVGVLF